MEKRNVGEFIAVLRKSGGFTQQALGEKIGVSPKTVSKWECGEGLPDVNTLPALSKELGVSIEELLCGQRLAQDVANQTTAPAARTANVTAPTDTAATGTTARDAGTLCFTRESRFKVLTWISIGLTVISAAFFLLSFFFDNFAFRTTMLTLGSVAAAAAFLLQAINITVATGNANADKSQERCFKSIVFEWTYSFAAFAAVIFIGIVCFLLFPYPVPTDTVDIQVQVNIAGYPVTDFLKWVPSRNSAYASGYHATSFLEWAPSLVGAVGVFVCVNLRYLLRYVLVRNHIIARRTDFKSGKFNVVYAACSAAAALTIWIAVSASYPVAHKAADVAFSYLPVLLILLQMFYGFLRGILETHKRHRINVSLSAKCADE